MWKRFQNHGMGYDGYDPIGKRKEGILEPIQISTQNAKDNLGLDFGQDVLVRRQETKIVHKQQKQEASR